MTTRRPFSTSASHAPCSFCAIAFTFTSSFQGKQAKFGLNPLACHLLKVGPGRLGHAAHRFEPLASVLRGNEPVERAAGRPAGCVDHRGSAHWHLRRRGGG